MKITIISSVFFLVFFSVHSQKAEMDTTYRPRNYSLNVEQFRSYPDSHEDIIFLGNSITAYTYWNELLSLPQSRNRGISGDTTFGILERLDEVTEGKPSKIFLLIGINDISRNVPADLILRNYNRILARIQRESPRTEIFVQTILPVNNTFTRYKNHYNKNEIIAAVNNGLRQFAKEEKITLIDLHPHFLDEQNRLDKKYTEEGLHLNAAGYELWKTLLVPYLQREIQNNK